NIQKETDLVSHGSYSFDHASLRIATAENEAALAELLKDPSVAFNAPAAERMDVKVIGKSIPIVGGRKIPETSYVLWRMPFGAVLLIRDVNGKLTRLVAQKDGIRTVDASGYAKFFPMLEEAHHKARLARQAERATAKAAVTPLETPTPAAASS